jgi:parallel beta-helix repeat protein
LEDGAHTIVARGTDRGGNVGDVTLQTTIVNAPSPDTTPPTVTIESPASGTTLTGTVTVSGTANDDRGISGIEIRVDEGSYSAVTRSTTWSATVDTAGVADGAHTIAVRALDQAGNVGSASGGFTFENTRAPAPGPEPTPEPAPAPSTCSGVDVSPGDDIQSLINSHLAGTTFCVRAGVYRIATGILVKSLDRILGESGAIIDGQGAASYGIYGVGSSAGQTNVVVRNLEIRGVAGQGIKAGWDWTIENNILHDNSVGVDVNNGSVLRGNHIHHNARYGINGGPTRDILIENNEVAYNNTSNSCGGTCNGNAGGSKIVGSIAGTYGVVWRGNWVHDNTGPGIWSDGNVHNVLYEGNLVEGNSGPGIFHEISWDATIRNNIVRWNSTDVAGKSCWWGSQIHLNDSQNVRIENNQVRSGFGANGICLVDIARTESAPFSTRLANIDVRNNTIYLSGPAMSGLVGRAPSSVTFNWNTYYVQDLMGKSWAWFDAYPLTWNDFKARGQEVDGSKTLAN